MNRDLWLLLESAPVAIVSVRLDGTIYYINRSLEELFGYPRAELLDHPIEILLPERFHTAHAGHRTEYSQSPRVRPMGSGMDLWGRHKDGSEFPIEAGLSHIDLGGESLIIGSVVDITRRKQNEELLEQRVLERTSEIERRRSVAEGLRYILALLNSTQTLEKTLDYTVGQARRLMEADACVLYQFVDRSEQRTSEHLHIEGPNGPPSGHAPATAILIRASQGMPEALLEITPFPIGYNGAGQSVANLVTIAIDNLNAYRENDGAAGQDGAKKIEKGSEFLHQQLLVANEFRALLAVPISVKEELYGGITLYYRQPRFFSTEDTQLVITFCDHAALAIENARLQAQVEQSAVQAERSRIARDLHDSVTQTLFSANLLADILPVLQEKNPEEGKRRAAELRELTKGALAEMRTLLLELRPDKLAQVNFQELLRQLADAIQARARIPVTLLVDIESDGESASGGADIVLPVTVKTAFFYIAQEALNNVAKHARATQAALHYHDQPGQISLLVRDDGIGFDLKHVAPQQFGLNIIAERAAEIGAKLTIDSTPGRGTEVCILWFKETPS